MRITGLLLLFLFSGFFLLGQENKLRAIPLSSFEIMKLVDEQMRINNGLNLARLTVIREKGPTKTFQLSHFKIKDNSLIVFKSPSRGNVLKLLYSSLSQKIHVYRINTKQLSQKKSNDRFQPVLNSGFYFIDLNHPSFLDNFISKAGVLETVNKEKLLKVENLPLSNSLYGKVTVYVNPQKNYRLNRIDYFDTNNILLKTMNVYHGKLPSRLKKKTTIIYAPVKYETTDPSRNTISLLEYKLNNQAIQINNNIFQKENIEK